MRLHRLVGDQMILPRHPFIDHEAATHRVIDPPVDLRRVRGNGVEGREAHAVGMDRQQVLAVEDQIALLLERDLAPAEQGDPAALPDLLHPRRHEERTSGGENA